MHKVGEVIDQKEKIIGGIMTLGQFAWICAGLVFGATVSLLFYMIMGWFCLIIGIPACFVGIPFAFYKKYDMPLFKYFIEKINFSKKNKEYVNRRYGDVLTFSTDDSLGM